MEIKKEYAFQVDSKIIKNTLKENNFLIDYNKYIESKKCVIYFCSNDLYYPNNVQSFKEQLLKKNKFEWYGTRIKDAHKHIFIRDIQKQWYLGGINTTINTPEKLVKFLKIETEGYEITTLGSSAGGFAAIIFGQLLNAAKIFSFNGQFEIRSLLNSSSEKIDPLVFRNKNCEAMERWYDTQNFIINPSTIYYFQSNKSAWDIQQYNQVKELPINRIQFNTSNHGIPFLKSNLQEVLNLSTENLNKLANNAIINPLVFSIKIVGVFKTIAALQTIVQFGLKKIYIHTVLKFKW